MSTTAVPAQLISVYSAEKICVTDGVAHGDGMAIADDLVLDDVYQLKKRAQLVNLAMITTDDGFEVAPSSEVGTVGHRIHMDCAVTLMSPDGMTFEALILVELEADAVADIYVLPLATLSEKIGYRLVGIDRDTASARFAEVACVAFTRGTHITLASGAQVKIENLKVGDGVLTRDDGPQQIRWIGSNTVRAVGAFAPVTIRKGTLHNENDLVLSPDHRVFIYQRQDTVGAGRPELLVKVSDLVNGGSVVQQDGGFVDYFQLLFDEHQIIYAEGIAAESLLIDTRTRSAVAGGDQSEHSFRQHFDFALGGDMLDKDNAAEMLRKASRS